MSKPTVSAALESFIGQRFGRLVVRAVEPQGPPSKSILICDCDCGASVPVRVANAKRGHTRSCGCLQREVAKKPITHGGTNTPEYKTWETMHGRCKSLQPETFLVYGARGISVCAEWSGPTGFARFLLDMGPRPSRLHTIDRKDNDLGYSKDNCRWATPKQQSRNRRNNQLLSWNGETRCVGEWAEITGIRPTTIRNRLKNGWPIESVLTERPSNRKRKFVDPTATTPAVADDPFSYAKRGSRN